MMENDPGRKKALGRGLKALLGEEPPDSPRSPAASTVTELPVDSIIPSALQPRKTIDPDSLTELCDSIKKQGVVQPVVVREIDGKYELIVGERRWRASRMAGLQNIPAIVRHGVDDQESLALALIENILREDLNPIEEAEGYQSLIQEFDLTQIELSEQLGRNRSTIANSLRLLALPSEIQDSLREGRLSVGHAKVLLGIKDEDLLRQVFHHVLKKHLTVRATEKLIRKLSRPQSQTAAGIAERGQISGTDRTTDPHVRAVEEDLQRLLGTKVTIRRQGKGGEIVVEFYSDSDLNRIVSLLDETL